SDFINSEMMRITSPKKVIDHPMMYLLRVCMMIDDPFWDPHSRISMRKSSKVDDEQGSEEGQSYKQSRRKSKAIIVIEPVDSFHSESMKHPELDSVWTYKYVFGLFAQGCFYSTGYYFRHHDGPLILSSIAPTECRHVALLEHYVNLVADFLKNPNVDEHRLTNSAPTHHHSFDKHKNNQAIVFADPQTLHSLSEIEQTVRLIKEHNRIYNHNHNELEPIGRASLMNQHNYGYGQSTLTRKQSDCLPLTTVTIRLPLINAKITIDNTLGGYFQTLFIAVVYGFGPIFMCVFTHVVIQCIVSVPSSGVCLCARAIYVFLELSSHMVTLTLSTLSASVYTSMHFDLNRQLNSIIRTLKIIRYRSKLALKIKTLVHGARLQSANNNNINDESLATIQCNTQSMLECIDAMSINLMLVANTLLGKVSRFDDAFAFATGAFITWILSIVVLVLVFLYDNYADATSGELATCAGLIGLYIVAIALFSVAAATNGKMESEWNITATYLGFEAQKRIRHDLLSFMSDRTRFSIKAFGRPITSGSLSLILANQRGKKSALMLHLDFLLSIDNYELTRSSLNIHV
ncbi:hypothetical protein GZH46_00905, partial [Fragariocoptes setiger]